MRMDGFKKNQNSAESGLVRTFPFVEFVDLKKYEISKPKISIANVQIETPDQSFTKTNPPRLTPEAESRQKKKIFHFLGEAIHRDVDLVILPELSTSRSICEEIRKNFPTSQSIMVMGSYYDDYSQNLSLISVDGSLYGQMKNNPSYAEKDYMRRSKDVNVFINTPIGDFAVLICYDATDFSILAAIEGYTDFLICIARTRDVVSFRNIFNALTYLQYQYVIFCNDAQFGGSSFYLPVHRNRQLDTLGVKNEGIIYRDFDLKKLDEIRASPGQDDILRYPPASSKPRHIPHVEEEHRKKESFESNSFNYLSYIRHFEILNDFLAHVNISRSLSAIGGKESGSIYRLEDVLLKSCRAMYAPAVAMSTMKLSPIVLKYFLIDLPESFCENDRALIEKKKHEIIEKLSNMKGKQYLLFEIDLDIVKNALSTAPELIDEIIRVYDIEKAKKLRDIPKKLQIERNDLKNARAAEG